MKLLLLLKLIIGFMALSFALIGLFLPIWPTTPFVLAAIGCFSSTPKIRNKLLRISYFREYYESYMLGSGICLKTVVASLLFLWSMLTLSAILMGTLWGTIILAVIGTLVTTHILYISKKRNKKRVFLTREEIDVV